MIRVPALGTVPKIRVTQDPHTAVRISAVGAMLVRAEDHRKF